MRLNDIVRRGQDFLRTEQGRAVARKAADGASGVARKVAPKQASVIDKAQRAAHDYLDRQDGGTPGTPDTPGTPGR